ncbi:ParB/RepB/Spo0J family partition protein [Streptomyces tanashiensis]
MPGPGVSPALTHLASLALGPLPSETRVKVDLGQKKGKIVVEFASMDDLDRILRPWLPARDGSADYYRNAEQGAEG